MKNIFNWADTVIYAANCLSEIIIFYKLKKKPYWHFYTAIVAKKNSKMQDLCHFQITDLFQTKRSQPCAWVIQSFKK